jgi:hypothetical protein
MTSTHTQWVRSGHISVYRMNVRLSGLLGGTHSAQSDCSAQPASKDRADWISSFRATVGRQRPSANGSTNLDCISRRPRTARGRSSRDERLSRALHRDRHRRHCSDDLRSCGGSDGCSQPGRRRIAGLSGAFHSESQACVSELTPDPSQVVEGCVQRGDLLLYRGRRYDWREFPLVTMQHHLAG